MNRLSIDKQAKVISALVEGNSIRATCRMTGIAKNTIVKLLADLGRICAEYQDKIFRNLPCKRIQCDEIWSFCYAKEKNVPTDKKGIFGYGDIWTFTAICADTKLVPGYDPHFSNHLEGLFPLASQPGILPFFLRYRIGDWFSSAECRRT